MLLPAIIPIITSVKQSLSTGGASRPLNVRSAGRSSSAALVRADLSLCGAKAVKRISSTSRTN
jgi:hypothetical protein